MKYRIGVTDSLSFLMSLHHCRYLESAGLARLCHRILDFSCGETDSERSGNFFKFTGLDVVGHTSTLVLTAPFPHSGKERKEEIDHLFRNSFLKGYSVHRAILADLVPAHLRLQVFLGDIVPQYQEGGKGDSGAKGS